ncbi:leucyl/phenylalanyl-tRNA--protein transferase [Leucothrix pacifica]|uniref:Leucyl/phenylalanyl-tRNA--protein transferase n=1 Tax=Leucothrix pacifica TaxID=1247513 RepID=A0A317CQ86_9GAMM|nr:leucyl/phenylalanyl-tRNA--protein transferase [Leucothrix pacifica]PWQ98462.1 leucyl/phenylalanyl-tRNA--protein transferase [Leucothrix pacifica]
MSNLELVYLDPYAKDEPFPPPEMAWEEPNGLIAIGGDLSPTRLINAYKSGIFPWYNEGEPIYWWNPDPRSVLFPEAIKISRSLRKSIRNKGYSIVFDRNFKKVIESCAGPRAYSDGTWISTEMQQAYCRLHELGVAHSVEVYNRDDELVGGLYGISSDGVFSGESMFSCERDTSKIAFVALAWYAQQQGYSLIDCQIENPHLLSLGAVNIARKDYLKILRSTPKPQNADWVFDNSTDLSQWQPQQAG